MEWIEVKNREPDDGNKVFVYDGNFHVATFNARLQMGDYRYDCDQYDVIPTHWAATIAPFDKIPDTTKRINHEI